MKAILTLDFHDFEPAEDTLHTELERITAMIANEDYTSGEIIFDEEGESHRGWWTIEMVTE